MEGGVLVWKGCDGGGFLFKLFLIILLARHFWIKNKNPS